MESHLNTRVSTWRGTGSHLTVPGEAWKVTSTPGTGTRRGTGGHLTVPGEEVATPEDISTGGVDFTDERAVGALWDKWRTL